MALPSFLWLNYLINTLFMSTSYFWFDTGTAILFRDRISGSGSWNLVSRTKKLGTRNLVSYPVRALTRAKKDQCQKLHCWISTPSKFNQFCAKLIRFYQFCEQKKVNANLPDCPVALLRTKNPNYLVPTFRTRYSVSYDSFNIRIYQFFCLYL